MKFLATALAGLLLAGCETLDQFDQAVRRFEGQAVTPLGDGNTNFSAVDRFDGFTVTINYQHPQPGASNQVILNACRQLLDVAAIRAAQMRGRIIAPIDNRAITARTQVSNQFPQLKICTMSVPLRYVG